MQTFLFIAAFIILAVLIYNAGKCRGSIEAAKYINANDQMNDLEREIKRKEIIDTAISCMTDVFIIPPTQQQMIRRRLEERIEL